MLLAEERTRTDPKIEEGGGKGRAGRRVRGEEQFFF